MSDPIAVNKKAYHNFFLTDKWECGIELQGSEVKSIRAGEVNFADSYVHIDENEVWLYSLHIAPYAQASYMNVEASRPRRLLLHKSQIKHLSQEVDQKGLTIIPLKVYFNARGFAKMEIALCKGKKAYDHREDIKKREIDKKIKQTLKNRNN